MTSPPAGPFRANPVFWIMWLLPGSAVVAGFVTLGLAIEHGDKPLPESYHWEGARLDADFARARAAAALGIEVVFEARDGSCRARLSHAANDPASLMLLLTHGSDAGLDRRLRMARVGAGEYRVACQPLAAGKWRITLADEADTWSLGGNADGKLESMTLRARSPEGGAP